MKLLLFDIDGTILKMKENISKNVFSENLHELFGQDIDEGHLPDFQGMTDMEILFQIADKIDFDRQRLIPKLPGFWKYLNDKIHCFCTMENIELMPGYPEVLEAIDKEDNLKMALLTGNTKSNAYSKLSAHSLENYFPIGAFGDEEADRKKLVPIAIKRSKEYYNFEDLSGNDILIIGDSYRDIDCARDNAIPVMAVATGSLSYNQLSSIHPDYLFPDFSDTKEIINTIKNHFNLTS